MRKTTSAVDRLERELAAEGIKLKRSRLMQIVATVSGCRSDNEYAASSENLFPQAREVGTIEHRTHGELHILEDPRSGRTFAVDRKALEVGQPRADLLLASPYGGLLDIEGVRTAARPVPTVVEEDAHLPLFRFSITRAATETATVEVRAATIEEAQSKATMRAFWSDPKNATFYLDDDNYPDHPYLPDENDFEVEEPADTAS